MTITMTPRTLSHYELLEPLGEGGMGTVYRAIDTRLDRPVAVKVLRADLAVNEESRRRFIQEAKAASGLNHPHIVTIYDIGEHEGVDFIAMEYVPGQSLAGLIGRPGFRLDEMLTRAVQVADALAAAHAAGIVHRDLKPANIMVGDRGSVKVLDFGLAKLTKPPAAATGDLASTETQVAQEPLTERGAILGTTAYMSPEQAEGKQTDASSDVFSFGAVLYEMVTGRRAFEGATKMATLAAILEREPRPPRELNPAVSRDLEKLIARCLRKDPDRRWHSMADLKVALEEARDDPTPAAAVSPVANVTVRAMARMIRLVAGSIAIGGLALGWWWSRTATPAPGPSAPLTRLTSDIGWTDYPAISPDGRILAYASDRSGDGNLDIWIQQIPNGEPVRLTRNAADDIEPSFSADGSRIAFHSSRARGGVYVVPTLGGEERLLVEGGFTPRFFPDGSWIAYGVSEFAGSQIVVAPANGGPARKVAAGFYLARGPVWSPDGRALLFWGQRDRDAPPENNVDWYIAGMQGGAPRRTTAREALRRERFEAFRELPTPDAWAAGNRVIFHAHVGDSGNTWQTPIDPATGQVGAARRITFGTTDEAAAATSADGRMVFISRTSGTDIWTLPVEADRARVRGVLTRVTQDLADDYDPSVSADGRLLAFRSRRAGRFKVFSRDLTTGREIAVTATTVDDTPVISPDGMRVAYSFRQDERSPIFAVPLSGGSPEQLCSDCGDVEQWAPGGREILFVTTRDPSGIGRLRIGSAPQREWLTHARYGLFNARLSTDGRWVSFNARANNLAPARVVVAEVRNSAVAEEKEWLIVSEDGDAPAWSPDASRLYFWSNRDGSPCLWAQRLDPLTKRAAGSPQPIQHFHSRGLSWRNLYLGAPDIVVARDKILFNLGEHTGNVWMTELPHPERP
jgi:eukaryotic-like serine/threonine-protein kinase